MNPIANLRQNRLFDCTIVLLVLISWFCLMVPPACLIAAQASKAVSAVHHDTHWHKHSHQTQAVHDCDSTPCLESQSETEPAFLLTTPSDSDLPVAALLLFWAACLFNFRFFPKPNFRKPGLLPGRQISLIYRFCSLLN